ncbi:MAG: helix-turn-helix transcriptional regulator [Lachnospiraceae bacterium]|nr:helix-turn-helix transcriptional regulator [Lachnospiraceae bacterium]
MGLQEIIDERKISKYKLSKQSGVPYSTICDICTGKSDIRKSSAETVARIAHVLEMDFAELIGELDYPEVKKKASKKSEAVSDKSKDNKDSQKQKGSVKDNKKKESAKEHNQKESAKAEKDAKASGNTKKADIQADSNKEINRKSEENKDKYADRRAQVNTDVQNAFAQKKEEAYKAYCNDLENKKNEMGELAFLVAYLKNNEVEILYNLNRKRESKYLLKIVDELCVKYNFPLCKEYEEIRKDED